VRLILSFLRFSRRSLSSLCRVWARAFHCRGESKDERAATAHCVNR